MSRARTSAPEAPEAESLPEEFRFTRRAWGVRVRGAEDGWGLMHSYFEWTLANLPTIRAAKEKEIADLREVITSGGGRKNAESLRILEQALDELTPVFVQKKLRNHLQSYEIADRMLCYHGTETFRITRPTPAAVIDLHGLAVRYNTEGRVWTTPVKIMADFSLFERSMKFLENEDRSSVGINVKERRTLLAESFKPLHGAASRKKSEQ